MSLAFAVPFESPRVQKPRPSASGPAEGILIQAADERFPVAGRREAEEEIGHLAIGDGSGREHIRPVNEAACIRSAIEGDVVERIDELVDCVEAGTLENPSVRVLRFWIRMSMLSGVSAALNALSRVAWKVCM